MRTKIGIVILAAICVGLAIALIVTKKRADERNKQNAEAILDFTNQLVAANASLNDLRQVNLMLTNDLGVTRQELMTVSNTLTDTSGVLLETKTSFENAQNQIASLNTRIADLEEQNKALDDRATSLTNALAQLDAQIAETQRKLASSETNNVFLESELQKQLAQKAELERRFNDLDEVRTQVKKLREELAITRRLHWMSVGNYGTQLKGAELMMQRATAAKLLQSDYDLNVEVGSDGSVRVISPTNAPATNSPAR